MNLTTAGTGQIVFSSAGGYVRPTLNNWEALGAFGQAWNTFYVSSTAYLTGVSTTAGIYPTANNSVDLGGFANAWNEIFSSSTIRSATSTIVNTSGTSTLFVKSEASGARGGTIFLEDSDGSGCSVIFVNNGTLTTEIGTCPLDAN